MAGDRCQGKSNGGDRLKKYLAPLFMLIIFEAVVITLWLTKDNIFYLFNFSYIGLSVSLGIFLFIKKLSTQDVSFSCLLAYIC